MIKDLSDLASRNPLQVLKENYTPTHTLSLLG
jgi:hypothetical protein